MQWIRHAYHVPAPAPTPTARSASPRPPHRLGCSTGVVYYWIKTGKLAARRGTGNRLCIPWTEQIEAECRCRITESGHLNPAARRTTPRPAPEPRHTVSVPTGTITPKDQADQRNSITDQNIPTHDCRRGSMKHPSPPSPIGWRRRWWPRSWSRGSSRSSIDDSYGYRPGRSALDAVGACRQRCWKTDWVIDLDIQKFFDSVPWDLVVKAVEANTDQPWVVLYVRRWLHAPLQLPDGTLQQRDRGTPQGSPVSPVLANLFLHYAFDMWMAREFPTVRFERYVDDAVVHCVSERQARQVLAALEDRMVEVGLRLHPDKTRIVYCKDGRRRGDHRAHVVHVPWLHVPAARGAGQGRAHVRLVLARDQQGRLDQDRAGGAVLAAAPPHRSLPSAISHDGSIRSCGAGCSTTARSTGRRCIPS